MHTISINNIAESTSQQQAAETMLEQRSTTSISPIIATFTASSNLSYKRLGDENKLFTGTMGVSQNNFEYGFLPAFRNEKTKQVLLSRTANGKISPVHLLEGIPRDWFYQEGRQELVLLDEITSGFVRQGVFYTREETDSAIKIFNLDDE